LENKKLDATLAGRIGYLCNILVKTMEVSYEQSKMDALVSRLDALEGGE
jgi:hypothetical protein